ncbi:hypothetical protein RI367_002053 [Sorochytrium milnesiophthora]
MAMNRRGRYPAAPQRPTLVVHGQTSTISTSASSSNSSVLIEFPTSYAMQPPQAASGASSVTCARANNAQNNNNYFQCSVFSSTSIDVDQFALSVQPSVPSGTQPQVLSVTVNGEQCVAQDNCVGGGGLSTVKPATDSSGSGDGTSAASGLSRPINMGFLGMLPLWLVILIGVVIGCMLIGFGYAIYRNKVGNPEKMETVSPLAVERQPAPTGILSEAIQLKHQKSAARKLVDPRHGRRGSQGSVTLLDLGSGDIGSGLASDHTAIPMGGSIIPDLDGTAIDIDALPANGSTVLRKKTTVRREISGDTLPAPSSDHYATPSGSRSITPAASDAYLVRSGSRHSNTQLSPPPPPHTHAHTHDALSPEQDLSEQSRRLSRSNSRRSRSSLRSPSRQPADALAPPPTSSSSELTRKRSHRDVAGGVLGSTAGGSGSVGSMRRPPAPLVSLEEPNLKHRPSVRHNMGTTISPAMLARAKTTSASRPPRPSPAGSASADQLGDSSDDEPLLSSAMESDMTERHRRLQHVMSTRSSNTSSRKRDPSATRVLQAARPIEPIEQHDNHTAMAPATAGDHSAKDDRIRQWANQMATFSSGSANQPANAPAAGPRRIESPTDDDIPLGATLARRQSIPSALSQPQQHQRARAGTREASDDDEEDIPLAAVATTIARQNVDDVIDQYMP